MYTVQATKAKKRRNKIWFKLQEQEEQGNWETETTETRKLGRTRKLGKGNRKPKAKQERA